MQIIKAAISSLALLAGLSAQAEPVQVRSYAVLSLAGDSLALHALRHQVGSRTDNSPKEILPMETSIFDQTALIAARAELQRLKPNSKLQLMTTQDKGLQAAQNAMFEQPDKHAEDREYLKGLLKEQGVSHALVISKYRGIAELKLLTTTEGSGIIEGLGFYVDDMIETRNRADNTVSRGMVAPFAYVRVRLLDAATLQVLAEKVAKQSFVIIRPSADSSGMDTFAKMNGADKVRHIRTALEDAMHDTLPDLLEQ